MDRKSLGWDSTVALFELRIHYKLSGQHQILGLGTLRRSLAEIYTADVLAGHGEIQTLTVSNMGATTKPTQCAINIIMTVPESLILRNHECAAILDMFQARSHYEVDPPESILKMDTKLYPTIGATSTAPDILQNAYISAPTRSLEPAQSFYGIVKSTQPTAYQGCDSQKIWYQLFGGWLLDMSSDNEAERGSRFDPEKTVGKHGLTMAKIALRWISHHSLLRREHGDAVLIGASSVKHIQQNDLDKGPLPEEVIEVVDEAWASVKGLCTSTTARHSEMYDLTVALVRKVDYN
ncbi:hypothetical protein NEOLEDRAFT_1150391 [Neolentinus lepideus HHB14362 ss-1]|uniref:NADP-dependent oxidoreductase domain-containing protein n=1 Tax=Neolentinus lepideus HHB14362 ss-1 TaxID=1314782 RepID=A0A165Q5Q3_9AGAM|nr:hypothetical protein NEOLEDRAFT_1150391 [Neolentinus lepideus HHB14362 ss-1]